MFKVEFPIHDKSLARCIGKALLEYSGQHAESDFIGCTSAVDPDAVAGVDNIGGEAEVVRAAIRHMHEEAEAITATADISHMVEPKGSLFEDGAPGKFDDRGVKFSAMYCGVAAKPFYTSGKKKGQWKCKKGVDEATYDEWYARELAGVTSAPQADTAVDTDAAFGKTETLAEAGAPTEAGELFRWISECMAAERFAQPAVDAAYAATQFTMNDVFADPKAAVMIYQYLNAAHPA